MIPESEHDLRVRIHTYSGDPDLFVHPQQMTQGLENAAFSTQERLENEEIFISKQQREEARHVDGKYAICVYGKRNASYKLSVSMSDSNHFLEAGLAESAYINENQSEHFYYRDNALLEDGNLTF